MGWKKTLISLNAATKRLERERERQQRSLLRDVSKVDRSVEEVMQKARRYERALWNDPLKTLALRYELRRGFEAEPFSVESEIFVGHFSVSGVDEEIEPAAFEPKVHQGEMFAVQPLDVWFSAFGTFLALSVENDDPKYRIRPNWFKKSNPQTSPVFLVDEQNSHYYYPRGSSLSGEVLPGHPRIGIMAFEALRQVTDTLTIHFSGIKLSSKRGNGETFQFSIQMPSFPQQQELIRDPQLTRMVQAKLDHEATLLSDQLKKPSQVGCALLLVVLIAFAIICFSGGASRPSSWQLPRHLLPLLAPDDRPCALGHRGQPLLSHLRLDVHRHLGRRVPRQRCYADSIPVDDNDMVGGVLAFLWSP